MRRHSLLVRLLAISMVIAACSIAATAWLAVQSTTVSIQRDQGQALATDATIYDRLLGYAATHPGWEGVGGTVDELAGRTGRRIALTTTDGETIADSAGPSAPQLPVKATVVVDPLAVELTLKPDAGTDRIDSALPGLTGSRPRHTPRCADWPTGPCSAPAARASRRGSSGGAAAPARR